MFYLSNQSQKNINSHLLFVHPYKEAKKNFAFAFQAKDLTGVQRVKHFAVGLLLTIPLINSIALLILRNLEKAQNAIKPISLRKDDKPFYDWPFDKPMPLLLAYHEVPVPVPMDLLGNLFVDELFNEHIGGQNGNDFKLTIDSQRKLTVHYKDFKIELNKLMEFIDWSKLDEKWQNISKEQIKDYIKRSLIFENLSSEQSPFEKKNPFIWLYTSHNFYSWLNPLLRKGQLKEGALAYASDQTSQKILEKNAETINRIAKELFFVGLATTGNLSSLPRTYQAECRTIRLAHIPKDILNKLKREEFMVDRGFLSASGPGGGFAGGGPCDEESYRVKFVIQSKKGKFVNEFSALPENEVIFNPFTKFKILKYSGDEISGFRFELEET